MLHGGADLLQLYLEIIRRDAGQHQQKLVAAVADQQICFPDAAADGLCNGFQCQISGVVAVGIVADLEIVDIHQGDACRAEVIAHHFLVKAAVVGAGQGVVVQPMPVALFFFHAPGSGLGKLRFCASICCIIRNRLWLAVSSASRWVRFCCSSFSRSSI